MIVYLDIIFFENILMNYIILAATEVVTKSKARKMQLRLILASVLGSVYAVISYLKVFEFYENFFAKFILSVVMVYVAFSPNNLKDLTKKLLIFYMTSFVFGGCTISLMYLLKPQNVQLRNGVFVGTYPIKVALIAGVVAFVIIQIAFKINKAKLTSRDMVCEIEIFLERKLVKVKALIDTGNLLCDPITKTPVVIVEERIMKKIISEEFLECLDEKIGGDDENLKYKNRIRIIPFMSLGKENGMLKGIRVDKINVINDGEIIETRNVIVGIYKNSLSKNNKYNALIGLNLLEKKEINQDELITNF